MEQERAARERLRERERILAAERRRAEEEAREAELAAQARANGNDSGLRSSAKSPTPEPTVDPREHNEGDTELDEFLTPLLQQAGGSIQSLEYEFLNRALGDGTLLVCGAKLWNALHSDSWRHREAAA